LSLVIEFAANESADRTLPVADAAEERERERERESNWRWYEELFYATVELAVGQALMAHGDEVDRWSKLISAEINPTRHAQQRSLYAAVCVRAVT